MIIKNKQQNKINRKEWVQTLNNNSKHLLSAKKKKLQFQLLVDVVLSSFPNIFFWQLLSFLRQNL